MCEYSIYKFNLSIYFMIIVIKTALKYLILCVSFNTVLPFDGKNAEITLSSPPWFVLYG